MSNEEFDRVDRLHIKAKYLMDLAKKLYDESIKKTNRTEIRQALLDFDALNCSLNTANKLARKLQKLEALVLMEVPRLGIDEETKIASPFMPTPAMPKIHQRTRTRPLKKLTPYQKNKIAITATQYLNKNHSLPALSAREEELREHGLVSFIKSVIRGAEK